MRAALGLALLGMSMLGGCGQSETQIRDEIRAQLMNRCGLKIAPNTAELPGFDSDSYCRCVTDKAMGERSVAELKTLFDESKREQMIAQGRQAGSECLAQQRLSDEDKAGPTPATEPTNGVAPASAPERAPAKAEPAAPRRPRIEDTRETPQPRTEPARPPRPTPPSPEPEPAAEDEEEEPSDAV